MRVLSFRGSVCWTYSRPKNCAALARDCPGGIGTSSRDGPWRPPFLWPPRAPSARWSLSVDREKGASLPRKQELRQVGGCLIFAVRRSPHRAAARLRSSPYVDCRTTLRWLPCGGCAKLRNLGITLRDNPRPHVGMMRELVLVVDSDAGHRTGVSRLLRRAGYETVEVGTGEQALVAAQERRPSVVLLEVVLPEGGGYEICRLLKERFGAGLPVIFLSGARTESFDRAAGLMLGADDYIVKPYDAGELIARVRRLVDAAPAAVAGRRSTTLTPREREVLTLLVDGLGQAEIARRLYISFKTVGKHIEHILAKLDVHTRAQAVARALREGLV